MSSGSMSRVGGDAARTDVAASIAMNAMPMTPRGCILIGLCTRQAGSAPVLAEAAFALP
jgi:hypothetical protein